MGNTGKWIKSFLTGKRDKKEKNSSTQSSSVAAENPTTPIVIPPSIPKEKRRWSFRRSSATAGGSRDLKSSDGTTTPTVPACLESEREQKKHALAVVAATVAATDAAVAPAQAAAAVVSLTATKDGRASAIKEAAAIKIQSVFRSYLARKALRALRGLVKLQALVRGHLVRKQATATLRCMQALVTVQTRARAQRMMAVEVARNTNHAQSTHRRSTAHKFRHSTEIDRGTEKNIKTVEMDFGETNGSQKSRNSYSNHQHSEPMESQPRFSTHHAPQRAYPKQHYQQVSPAPSAITDLSPRTCSGGHFEDYTFNTTQSSPQYYSAASKPDPSTIPYSFPWPDYAELMSYDYPLYPNYMANTESSRAKARSQSAPKQRPDSFERQPSCSRGSVEGRNVPKVVRMQRSSSHVGSTAQNYQYPWSIKLDRSNVSLKDSECRSTCSVLTNPNCRSLVSYYVSNDQTTKVP